MKHLLLTLPLVILTGCSTSQKTLLPVDGTTTMRSIWERQTGGSNLLYDQRSQLRRPLTDISVQEQQGYTRTSASEIRALFTRLPSPDMVMYVYPHLTGEEGVPIPGYTTVFPLHTRILYAMPGERTEAL